LLLAQRQYDQKHYAEAERFLLEVLAVDAQSRQAREFLSVVYQQTRRPEQARQQLEYLVSSYPGEALYCERLVALLERRGETHTAIECYRRLLDLRPELADSHYNYARLLNRAKAPQAALDQYGIALDLGISQPEDVYSNMSVILSDQHRHQEAEEVLNQALEISPDYVPALYNLGVLREELGLWEGASELFLKILELEPDHLEALTHLAHAQKIEDPAHPLVNKLQLALSRCSGELRTSETLHFALGKVYDDSRQYDNAFEHFLKGNQLSYQRAGAYDRTAAEALMRELVDNCKSGWLTEVEPVSQSAPIFICGMFRSGSTLLEQMLAAHPDVSAGGELNFFNQHIHLPSMLTNLDPVRVRELGNMYLEYLARGFPNAVRVTNKRPDNFAYLGFIRAMFPNAKFINTCRHPLDNCLSIYFQQFAGSVKYHTQLLDIGHYYAQYRGLMEFWKRELAGNIVDIDYQLLVGDPRAQLEPLLEFLELEWYEGCLEFHKSDNRVRTASVWQVRQPLYQQSKGRWHNYAKHVESLQEYLHGVGIET
jgi:tetratricopeptide (TPR) repeat protein